jgi:hypothetical protein
MAKATHNGTCQACGRQHAVRTSGRLADHGYTTAWGFFHGICQGAGHQPLELATELNVQIVADYRAHAAKLDKEAQGDITKVPVSYRGANGKTVTEVLDSAEWAAHRATYCTWDRAVEAHRRGLHRQAELVRALADDLEALRARRHGQALIERPVEVELKREQAKSYREAHARCEELKAQGKLDVRQRRNSGWQGGFAITYREAA